MKFEHTEKNIKLLTAISQLLPMGSGVGFSDCCEKLQDALRRKHCKICGKTLNISELDQERLSIVWAAINTLN